MDEMGHRLLDWFKQLHDVMKERHVGKRSSRKKELKDESKSHDVTISTHSLIKFDAHIVF